MMLSLWETMLGRWLDPGSGEPEFAGLAAGAAPAAPAIAVRREPAAKARAKPPASRGAALTLTPAGRAAE